MKSPAGALGSRGGGGGGRRGVRPGRRNATASVSGLGRGLAVLFFVLLRSRRRGARCRRSSARTSASLRGRRTRQRRGRGTAQSRPPLGLHVIELGLTRLSRFLRFLYSLGCLGLHPVEQWHGSRLLWLLQPVEEPATTTVAFLVLTSLLLIRGAVQRVACNNTGPSPVRVMTLSPCPPKATVMRVCALRLPMRSTPNCTESANATSAPEWTWILPP